MGKQGRGLSLMLQGINSICFNMTWFFWLITKDSIKREKPIKVITKCNKRGYATTALYQSEIIHHYTDQTTKGTDLSTPCLANESANAVADCPTCWNMIFKGRCSWIWLHHNMLRAFISWEGQNILWFQVRWKVLSFDTKLVWSSMTSTETCFNWVYGKIIWSDCKQWQINRNIQYLVVWRG